MTKDPREEVRAQLLQALMDKVEQDTYPSSTMLDTIEEMLTPAEIPQYAAILLERVENDTYPSIDMIYRLRNLQGR